MTDDAKLQTMAAIVVAVVTSGPMTPELGRALIEVGVAYLASKK